ncbi:hypothetical protein I6U48_26760 [Clostridium sp. PL3]|uniref:Uncharacterized protein n=1 Tax=Clostridium thailandense TaxID=2794346 RepID=A0A949TU17_9CLOT|nr:hypothetical protein [Clostridium thailandense]MBV7276482.1 hypothetical protein [Clostridium thailandense]
MKNMQSIYIRVIMCINLSTWIIAFFIISLVDRARPPFESFLNRLKDEPVRKVWNSNLMEYVYYLLILAIVLNVFSIILNTIAYKKEKIGFRINSFFLGICLLYGLVMYLIHF